ncbi:MULTISPECIES: hypothetical protein [unclassified Pseudoalteromonas]|uniref:hypothetical protein n=1 Tax=unclassified Pseudoalteromonas TaxID=194690 RepID=UPI0020973939|nr:hypothetical protein [Pseudoalteromonas sp. XMcav2-N]MCO7189519.1 hypothetical protein [Pseudoalteromonas sp. XMcav2-N]
MNKVKFEYDAIKVVQTKESKPLILFGAKAVDIEKWAGIPQKKTLDPGAAETTGFQRSESPSRLRQLSNFYKNKDNVVQNNLICSLRKLEGCSVDFIPNVREGNTGQVIIEFPDFYSSSWETLFALLRSSLESRVGGFDVNKSSPKYLELKSQIGLESDNEPGDELELEAEEDIEAAIYEESHLNDFLEDVAIRHELIKELGSENIEGDKFLGFDRASLMSFLLPVTLVDGQHRLKGAVIAAEEKANENKHEGIQLLESGIEADQVFNQLKQKYSRELPVSLLMEDEPKEQVFQFVVINQKATPIGKSLLGTIISTTLTTSEMEDVNDRLLDSGIALEDARAITWAARNPQSPFCGLVERGTSSDQKDLLQWNVMGSLIQIFRELKGGKLFHAKNDYAKRWKEKFLESSDLIESNGLLDAYKEWSALQGPWQEVFIQFWVKIKQEFAQDTNPSRNNFWGNPRKSNIFNKISLTILASDFFKYLVTKKVTINNAEDIPELVDDWLEDVNRQYFDQEWELSGIKKDSPGIRARWSENWAEYRESPDQLPQARTFRNPRKS